VEEKEVVTVVEEGGLVVYADIETNIIKLFETKAEIICPNCGETMALNGRCKTCNNCGWSSCDL
jgi:predicted RNA-binding Zn-ribbon protein involved in translation (DUF1610 family)